MSKRKTPSKLARHLIHDANKMTVCRNCKFSWINHDTGYGRCGRNIYPRPIEEWDTCEHWQTKVEKKKE